MLGAEATMPIIYQLGLPKQYPFSYDLRRVPGQPPADDSAGLDSHNCFEALIKNMDVRRSVIAPVHLDNDAIENRYRWHRTNPIRLRRSV
jgi:hypothetical protein